MIKYVLAMLAIIAFPSATRAQPMPDFSGTWQCDPGRTVTLRRVDRGPVRWGPIPYTTRNQTDVTYVIVIVQDTAKVDITFPGGKNSFMNVGAYQLDSENVTTVSDKGDWWVKTVTRATRHGDALVLTATRLMDWWKTAKPAEVTSQEAETDTTFVLRLSDARTELTIETTLSDEKGHVTYRQVFNRH
jgi:hypothetical protein